MANTGTRGIIVALLVGGIAVLWSLAACRPITPPAEPATPPIPPSIRYNDGMGGTLILPEDVPLPPTPGKVYRYRAHHAPLPTPETALQWARRWALDEPWIGLRFPGTPGPAVLLLDRDRGVGLEGDLLLYLRLSGEGPREEPPDELLVPALPHPLKEVHLRLAAASPAWVKYTAAPLLDGLPLISAPPWAELDLDPTFGLRSIRLVPITAVDRGQPVVPRALSDLLNALRGPHPPHPLGRLIRPTDGDPLPLARHTDGLPWTKGASITLIGPVWIYRGGPGGDRVRAWIHTPAGTFEIHPVTPRLVRYARQGNVRVRGVLEEGNPHARRGIVRGTDITQAPPRTLLKGRLDVRGSGVYLQQEDGPPIPLDGLEPDALPSAPVWVEGYLDDTGFVWEEVYARAPRPSGELTVPPHVPRTVVRVAPVYWLRWDTFNSEGIPLEGEIVPAWQFVARAGNVEDILIYPMTEESGHGGH